MITSKTIKPDMIIGIDPDSLLSGVATLNVHTKTMKTECMSFPTLLEYLQALKSVKMTIRIYVEASWLQTTSNFHKGYYDKNNEYHKNSEKVNENISNKNGRNHETGRKIIEMSRYYGLDTMECYPLVKCWKGPGHKITQGEIEQFIPDFPKRSNQEMRDAALIAWQKADLPIRVKA